MGEICIFKHTVLVFSDSRRRRDNKQLLGRPKAMLKRFHNEIRIKVVKNISVLEYQYSPQNRYLNHFN